LSRASVFYYDRGKSIIYGKAGIGPYDEKEAVSIWRDLSMKSIPLESYLEHAVENTFSIQRFPEQVCDIAINFDELPPENYFKRVISERKFFHITDMTEENFNLPEEIRRIFVPSEIIILP